MTSTLALRAGPAGGAEGSRHQGRPVEGDAIVRSKTRWAVAGALSAAGLAGAMVAGPVLGAPAAGATPHGARTRAPVASGVDAAVIPHASAFGTTPGTTPETVSFVLKPRNAEQLASSATRPLSSFLSSAQFAALYGQTARTIHALTNYLSAYGIAATVYADGLDVHAHGTAAQFDAALAIHQREYYVPAVTGSAGMEGTPAQTVHSPTSEPSLPRELGQSIEAVLGLDNYGPYVSQAVHVPHRTARHQTRTASTTTCQTATPGMTDANACHTPAYFASQYGLDGLYATGAQGQGQTIGIVTLAPLDTTAPGHFWQTVLHVAQTGRTVTTVTVDGGPATTPTGSGETDLDAEQSGAIAPAANIDVYQAPNTTSGFVDAFFAAATSDVASDVSVSWGESETFIQAAAAAGQLTRDYVGAFDEAFMEMAVQGQSLFAAAGDTGAYDAYFTIGATNLSVDNPADSPYVTAAGGTTTPFSATVSSKSGTSSAAVSVSSQRAWGWDYLWPAAAAATGIPEATAAVTLTGGGGGGYSALEQMPPYQRMVPGITHYSDVEYLTPTTYVRTSTLGNLLLPRAWHFAPTPPVAQGTANGRAVPDVSADADPFSGYLLYGPTVTTGSTMVLQGGWGGTSFVSPQLNGATAVIDSALGHRVGFWNPKIYAFAVASGSPFSPLATSGTGNDNLFYTGTPGSIYNPATGLGTPNLTQLASDFAAMPALSSHAGADGHSDSTGHGGQWSVAALGSRPGS